jgi:D-amino peptidase
MRNLKTLTAAVLLTTLALPLHAQTARSLKVFISIDMEGLAGVVSGSDVSAGPNSDYAHFRTIMAGEANAAVDGAIRAGATYVLVRDSHGSKQNLLPGDLDPRASLLRGASTGPKNMMEGIDSTFDAVRRARRARFSSTRAPATSWISASTACRCRRAATTRW